MACWFQLNTFTTGNIGLMGLGTGTSGSTNAGLWFSGNALYFYANGQGSVTTQLFRDIGWYHVLGSWKLDESNMDKGRLFINGEEVTSFSDDRRDNWGTSFGSTATQSVGSAFDTTMFTGYIAQPIMLDGQSVQGGDVAITDFVDTFTFGTNGSQVIPKKDSEVAALASSAGGNSFCLDFSDSSGTDAVNLGNDISSGNKDLTPSSMAAANQSVHTPSLVYPIMNPLNQDHSTSTTLSEGNLKVSMGTAAGDGIKATLPCSGKVYWEVEIDSISSNSGSNIGIATNNHNLALTADDTSGNGQRDAFVGISSFDSNLKGFISGSNFLTSFPTSDNTPFIVG